MGVRADGRPNQSETIAIFSMLVWDLDGPGGRDTLVEGGGKLTLRIASQKDSICMMQIIEWQCMIQGCTQSDPG